MAAVCKQLASAGIASSVRSVGAPFDNTLAETINGLVNTDFIHHPEHGPWNTFDEVEYFALDWLNHCRLLEINGDIPPAEFEKMYHEQIEEPVMTA